jgi:hypothetical protein
MIEERILLDLYGTLHSEGVDRWIWSFRAWKFDIRGNIYIWLWSYLVDLTFQIKSDSHRMWPFFCTSSVKGTAGFAIIEQRFPIEGNVKP